VTFTDTLSVSYGAECATLDVVSGLDFRTPFDELTELRSTLTTQEIADLTGLRRETLSRARPGRRFQRRTEKAIGDLYLVVTRMRATAGGDLGQLAAVLRRPQAALGDRSVADLLKEGRVDLVLEHLETPDPVERGRRPNFRLSPRTEAKLKAYDPVEAAAATPAIREREEDRVAAFLAGDPELAALLPEIEAKVRECFAPVGWLERGIIVEYEGEADDVLYLWAHNDLSFDENEKRFMAFLGQQRDFLRPVRSRLNIGFV
jgi:hypothetical protein